MWTVVDVDTWMTWHVTMSRPVTRNVADSLGITNLSEVVAGALSSDVAYRLHQSLKCSFTTMPRVYWLILCPRKRPGL